MRVALVLAILVLAGCTGSPPKAPSAGSPAPLAQKGSLLVASPAFNDSSAVPKKYTCDGDNVSPPLAFVVNGTNATHLAMILYDPDALVPQAPTRNITHWIWWNAPLVNGSAAFGEGNVSSGTVQGKNENGDTKYMGPCPPQVSTAHRYVFHAFALAAPLDLPEGSTRAQLESALSGHAVAEGTLIGTYARAVP